MTAEKRFVNKAGIPIPRVTIAVSILVFFSVPIILPDAFLLRVLILTGIFLLLALSLNLVAGYVGLLSLAQTAFFGLGAYASALLALNYGAPFWIGLAFAGLFAALVALGVGPPALRLSRHSFVIATLALLIISDVLVRSLEDVTRGPLGLPGIPPPRLTIPGVVDFAFTTLASQFYLIFALVAGTLLFLYRLVHSRIGRAFLAIREDETLAKAVGIDVMRYKILAFVTSAVIAGAAGSYYAHYITFIDPSLFDFFFLENALIMYIVGGPGSLWGVTVGAFIFTALPELLRVAKELRLVVFGGILLIAILRMPDGIAGAASRLTRRWAK